MNLNTSNMNEQGTYSAEHIERLLQCAICLDRYRQPKILPCQHTFCESPCLEGLVRGYSRSLKCPECRAEHFVPYQGVSGFPNNLTIKNFLDLPVLRQLTETDDEARNNVAAAPAEPVRIQQPNYPNFGPAAIFPDSPTAAASRTGCASCSREVNLIRCPHCDQILCNGCKASHMQMVQSEVTRILSQIRRSIPRLSNAIGLVERKSEQIRQRSESAKADITETIERYIMELRGRQRLLHSEVDMFLLGEIRSLRMHQENIESDMAEIASFCDSTDSTLNRSNRQIPDDDLVDIKGQCAEHLENISVYDEGTYTVPRERSLQFLMEESRLSNAISNFGEVLVNHSSLNNPQDTVETESLSSSTSTAEEVIPTATPMRYSTASDDTLQQTTSETARSNPRSSYSLADSDTYPYSMANDDTDQRSTSQSARSHSRSGYSDIYTYSNSPIMSRRTQSNTSTDISSPMLTPRIPSFGESEILEPSPITSPPVHPVSQNEHVQVPTSYSYTFSPFSVLTNPTTSSSNSSRSAASVSSPYLIPTTASTSYYSDNFGMARVTSSPSLSDALSRNMSLSWPDTYDTRSRLFPRRSLQEIRRRNYTDSIAGILGSPTLTSKYSHPLSTADRRIRSLSTGASLFRINQARGYIASTRGQRTSDEEASASGGSRPWMHTLEEGNESIDSESSREGSVENYFGLRHPYRTNSRYEDDREDPEVFLVLDESEFDGNESMLLAEATNKYENKGTATGSFGSRGNDQMEMMWPRGVARAKRENYVFIADSSNHRVQVLDGRGNYVRTFGSYGEGEGEFDSLTGIAVNTFGQVIVADRYNHRIQIFDIMGNFQLQFCEEGVEAGQLLYPWGVACDQMGFIYVCDKENHRIQVFQSNGSFVRKFGTRGTRPGQFHNPHYLAISPDNRIYVTDSSNNRVQVFSMYGDFLFHFGSLGTMQGQMRDPKGIAIDDQGFVIVGDSGNNRIQVFHGDGRVYCMFGCYGSSLGEFNTIEGVTILNDGTVVVCDRENHRVQYFSS